MSCDVSVVIPLYNTEKFIRQCVDSDLAQTLTNIEIIIVNDCSTDNGPALCEELYGHNDRVKIIHHEKNSGIGATRNTGTLHAEGTYVCYVDSDDEVFPDHLSNMFKTAVEYDADVVHNTRAFSIMPKKGEKFPLEMLGLPKEYVISFCPDQKELTELTLLDYDLPSRLEDWVNHSYHFSVWNSMYKRSFLREHNILFDKMKLAEDAVFYFQCMFNARRFVVRPGAGYLYRVVDASLSRSRKSPEVAVKGMQAQLDVVEAMEHIMSNMPFFRDSEINRKRAINEILMNLENGFVKTMFQSLGEESMRSAETVNSFFADNFGDKAPYVEFLFYELHKLYPPIIDYNEVSSDIEKWREMEKK